MFACSRVFAAVCLFSLVFAASAGGEAVVPAASNEYKLLARNPLGEGSHSTPVVAEGTMYLRTFSHLISLGGRN